MAIKNVSVDWFTGDYYYSTLTSGLFPAQNLSTDELRVQGDWRDNEVVGGPNNDTVFGDGGNDRLFGQGGNDILYGGEGNDQLFGGSGNDTLSGGNSTSDGSLNADGRDLIDGGSGNDTVRYDSFRGRILMTLAESGDTLVQQYGPAVNGIETNLGDDTLRGIENITGAQGDDAITGNSLANQILGHFGNDLLLGGGGNDTLIGGTTGLADQGRDSLLGGNGDDLIMGGYGNDLIIGGQGADMLYGGFQGLALENNLANGGNDTFVFQNDGLRVGFTLLGGSFSGDQIMDFSLGDKIDLSQIDANTAAKGDQSFRFANDFTGLAGQLVVDQKVDAAGFDQWLVSGDTNGDRIADFNMLITAQNGLNLATIDHITL